MKTILKIQSSLFGANGQSSQLADHFIEACRKKNADVRVLVRDLAAEPVPPLDLQRFQALNSKPEERSSSQQAVVDFSDALIGELQAADVIVLAAPMYNFNIPSALQSYFDHVARSGVTFRYTDEGPQGLLKGKQVQVFITRGGQYGEHHAQGAYLRQMLDFIGLTDARFVFAEGLAMGDAIREKSLATARHAVAKLVTPLANAA